MTFRALFAALALLACGAPAAGATPNPPGSLVLVGGALAADNDAVYREIIDRAGGSRARIGVVTAASVPPSQDPDADDPQRCSNSACNGAYYADLFRRHGAADAQWIPVDLDSVAAADSPAVVDQVRSMTGFFFGGGDQYRYVSTLLRGERHADSAVLAAIRAELADGAVVAGTSAGAQIAAGRDMVTGGESYEGLRDGSAPGYFDDPTRLGYLKRGGFGFLRTGLIDTHTGAYGREGRAIRLAADTGHDRVYALDENTAIVVEHPGTARESIRVLGEQGVGVLDLRHARTRGRSVDGVSYSYLTDGDTYDPRRRSTRPGPGKRALAPTDLPVPANDDVFSSLRNPAATGYSFRSTARALAASTRPSATASTYETGPRFEVAFDRRTLGPVWTLDGRTAATLVDLAVSLRPLAATSDTPAARAPVANRR